jgi:PIN domain nuclease of toxin-antitoxin system
MVGYVIDTHAVIWYLYQDNRLSSAALAAINQARQLGITVGLPGICLIEIIYLVEKQKIPSTAFDDLIKELDSPGTILREVALDRQITQVVRTIPRASIPDMPDRIIAATALHLDVPLISRDAKIQISAVTTIW